MLYFVFRSSIPDFGENIITRHVCVTDASLTSVTGNLTVTRFTNDHDFCVRGHLLSL